ncbi:ROK family protein [Rhizomicrobium electricum]|uniref:ROK family protein n=1 Tax=Rhizomicrobium electricum TaxID=480070 RepID=A0ABN1E0Z7_9PROT|nr:ROK family protein [Rhizomicrobium electricum]NIJ47388.1 fructokinase [Rhizomicrobium electricum]
MRFGIDLGGTKIEIMALDTGGREILRERVPTPRDSYDSAVRAIVGLVEATEAKLGRKGSVGIGIPGAISPKTGFVKNANSVVLIGHPLDKDLSSALARPVRVENDANCFALSEASDGAAMGVRVVFGVITGTGVGGGVVVDGRVLTGAHAVAGEWGHNALPRPSVAEVQHAQDCYCGKKGCIETWCSGPALARLYEAHTGVGKALPDIVKAATLGEQAAVTELENFYDRLARALSEVVNILDPDVIVMGGGLSNIDALYTELPPRVEHYAFTTEAPTKIVRNKHGDSSGVRGAAWLWTEDEVAAGLAR